MSEKTKVEANLYGMEKGEIVSIEYNGEVFVRVERPSVECKTSSPVNKTNISDGSMGFCRNYGVHVQKEDFDSVMEVIHKDGSTTSKQIANATGMTIPKTRAILRFMKDQSAIVPVFRKRKVFYIKR
jgi:hypothetical protein